MIFQRVINTFKNLQFCMHAHDHRPGVYQYFKESFGDDLYFYACTCMKKRGYHVFTVTANGYEYEEVEF